MNNFSNTNKPFFWPITFSFTVKLSPLARLSTSVRWRSSQSKNEILLVRDAPKVGTGCRLNRKILSCNPQKHVLRPTMRKNRNPISILNIENYKPARGKLPPVCGELSGLTVANSNLPYEQSLTRVFSRFPYPPLSSASADCQIHINFNCWFRFTFWPEELLYFEWFELNLVINDRL